MPEGPEIRLAADKIAKVLVDKRIVEVSFGLSALREFERPLAGCTVTGIDTRGKAMLTRFDNGLTLYSHNQLYGRWYTTRRPNLPKTNRSLRVALHTDLHSALLYSASDVKVLNDKELSQHAFLQRIGPDILASDLTAEQIAMRLDSQKFRKRALASLYLDQSFLAGIGNYLRSEILWAAGVDPSGKPADFSPSALSTIANKTLQISRRSYRTRGVTAAPTLVAQLKASGMKYQGYRFSVFGREGLPCYRCETPVRRSTMGGRNIFVCSRCQPLK